MVESACPNGGVTIKVIHVSNMVRAKETADLISHELRSLNSGAGVPRTPPDPNLNEGRPAHVIPSRHPMDSLAVAVDGPRIEAAFRTYFYRATEKKKKDKKKEGGEVAIKVEEKKGEGAKDAAPSPPPPPTHPAGDATVAPPPTKHEFEIVVCHGNVIRYFFMRALQLPPEAWLRLCTFNCSLTYFTVRPNGNISCRSLGDTGHLSPEETTFSGHHGFNW